MSSNNGLISEQASSRPGLPYYLSKDQPLLNPSLISPVQLLSADLETAAAIECRGYTAGEPTPYSGAIKLLPGASSVGAAAEGLTIRSVGGGTQVEVGTDGETPNVLAIAGASGLAQVYDEIYNQPVQLQPITLVSTDPDCVPQAGNVGEIFRCGQTAVGQAGAGQVQFNTIRVPRAGAYMMQTEIVMGNSQGQPNTVVLPSTLVGGVPVWNSLDVFMQVSGTVQPVPYSTVEVIGGDFQAIDTFATGKFTKRVFSQILLLDTDEDYAIVLAANSAAWNIGSAGQIKVELIAMC
jgi:hypothetical protein